MIGVRDMPERSHCRSSNTRSGENPCIAQTFNHPHAYHIVTVLIAARRQAHTAWLGPNRSSAPSLLPP